MAYPGKVIVCPPRGERVVFLQTGGETNGNLLQIDYYAAPGGGYIDPHIHIAFEEQFEIIAGIATYSVNGVEKTAHPGEVFSIPPYTKHVNPWNNDATDTLYLRQTVAPPYGTEIFLETFYGCVRDQRHVTRDNQLNMLQAALTVQYARTQTYSAYIPLFVQRIFFPVFAFIASLLGYQPYYLGY